MPRSCCTCGWNSAVDDRPHAKTDADADADADAIVVGAGPAGSSAAYHVATQRLRVLMLERSTFPRDKVCGDGRTPRAVQHVQAMGVDDSAPGWEANREVRFVRGRTRLELEWLDLLATPGFGLTRTRLDFDGLPGRAAYLSRRAVVHADVSDRSGARLLAA